MSDIRKGKFDTYTALYDNFNLPDLVAYCKQESLKVSGKKPELIKRIVKYIETGEKEVPQKSGKRGRGKKAAATTKKQKSEKSEKAEKPKKDAKESK